MRPMPGTQCAGRRVLPSVGVSREAGPIAPLVGIPFAPKRLGQHLSHPERRPTGGILLEMMVRLHDFYIVVIAQESSRVPKELIHHIDPETHVGRDQAGNALGHRANVLTLLVRKTRRPDYHRTPWQQPRTRGALRRPER